MYRINQDSHLYSGKLMIRGYFHVNSNLVPFRRNIELHPLAVAMGNVVTIV